MKIAVIGHGRFGKLWANCLSKFEDIFVYDKNKNSRLNNNPKIHFQSLEIVTKADLLFLAVPMSEFENICKDISQMLSEKTIVVDTCSVKIYPVELMERYFSKSQPIIASHPLFGPDSVSVGDLKDKEIIISQVRASREQENILTDLLIRMDLNIINMSLREHDKCMARSQALVHFLGRVFAKLDLKDFEAKSPNYKALMKINNLVNNDTWQLFFDMQKLNPFAKDLRKNLIRELKALDEVINKEK